MRARRRAAGRLQHRRDDVLTGADLARELGLTPLPIPARLVHGAARAAAALPKRGLPPAADWVESLSHPAIMDTSKARRQLGWQPKFTARQALRETLRGGAEF